MVAAAAPFPEFTLEVSLDVPKCATFLDLSASHRAVTSSGGLVSETLQLPLRFRSAFRCRLVVGTGVLARCDRPGVECIVGDVVLDGSPAVTTVKFRVFVRVPAFGSAVVGVGGRG